MVSEEEAARIITEIDSDYMVKHGWRFNDIHGYFNFLKEKIKERGLTPQDLGIRLEGIVIDGKEVA